MIHGKQFQRKFFNLVHKIFGGMFQDCTGVKNITRKHRVLSDDIGRATESVHNPRSLSQAPPDEYLNEIPHPAAGREAGREAQLRMP